MSAEREGEKKSGPLVSAEREGEKKSGPLVQVKSEEAAATRLGEGVQEEAGGVQEEAGGSGGQGEAGKVEEDGDYKMGSDSGEDEATILEQEMFEGVGSGAGPEDHAAELDELGKEGELGKVDTSTSLTLRPFSLSVYTCIHVHVQCTTMLVPPPPSLCLR